MKFYAYDVKREWPKPSSLRRLSEQEAAERLGLDGIERATVREMCRRDRRCRAIGIWAAVLGIVALAAVLASAFYMYGGRP